MDNAEPHYALVLDGMVWMEGYKAIEKRLGSKKSPRYRNVYVGKLEIA